MMWRVVSVKGGALDGSSLNCQALRSRQAPGRWRLQLGWKCWRLEIVSPASEIPSPSSHRCSMYSSTWRSSAAREVASANFCDPKKLRKFSNALR